MEGSAEADDAAAAGGVGTFSGVNADSYDENGNLIADEIVALRFENNDNSEEDDED